MGWRGWPSDGRHTFNQFTLELSRTTVGWARPGPTLSRPPGGLGGRLERTIQPGRTRVPIGDWGYTRVNKKKAASTHATAEGSQARHGSGLKSSLFTAQDKWERGLAAPAFADAVPLTIPETYT